MYRIIVKYTNIKEITDDHVAQCPAQWEMSTAVGQP